MRRGHHPAPRIAACPFASGYARAPPPARSSSRSAPTNSTGSSPTRRNRSARATSLRCWVRLRWTAPTNSPARPVPILERSGIPTNRPASSSDGRVAQQRGRAAEPLPDEAQPHLLRRERTFGGRARAPRGRRTRPAPRPGSRAYSVHPARPRSAEQPPPCPWRSPAYSSDSAQRISSNSACSAVTHRTPYLITTSSSCTAQRFTRTPGRDRTRSLPAASTTGSRVSPSGAKPSKYPPPSSRKAAHPVTAPVRRRLAASTMRCSTGSSVTDEGTKYPADVRRHFGPRA